MHSKIKLLKNIFDIYMHVMWLEQELEKDHGMMISGQYTIEQCTRLFIDTVLCILSSGTVL